MGSIIQAHNEVESCKDVITWLRAASTASRQGGRAQTVLLSVLHDKVHVTAPPPEVSRYVTATVQSDLPVQVAPERLVGGILGAETLASTLRLLKGLQAMHVMREEDNANCAPKTIAEAYKEMFSTTLK